jgi:DNA gyrase subunit A
LKSILADEKKILKIIKDELLEIKKQYGDERRTKIIPGELGKMSDEDLIAEEQVVVTLTANYIKRSPIAEYKRQGRGGKGRRGMVTREEDVIEHVVNASTHDYLLFFTNRGRVFRLKTYELPTTGLSAKGVAIVNLLQLQPEETVSAVINVSQQHDTTANLIMCTVRGVVKKTPFEQYKNVRSSGLIAINLDDGDELKWIRMTTGDNEVLISTSQGQAIRFHERDVRPMGRVARGVRGIRLARWRSSNWYGYS